mgnify:CR=1 FL=1
MRCLQLIARGARRGGESTLSLDQWTEAAQVFDLVERGDESAVLVDVTPVNRTRNFRNFILETPEFFDELFVRLLNKPIHAAACCIRSTRKMGGVTGC